MGEADAFQHGFGLLPGAFAPGARRGNGPPERKSSTSSRFWQGGQMWKHRIALEDDASCGVGSGTIGRSPTTPHRRSAAPGRAGCAGTSIFRSRWRDQRQELAGLGGDVDPFQHAGIAVILLQPMDNDTAHLFCTG